MESDHRLFMSGGGPRYVQMQSEPSIASSFSSSSLHHSSSSQINSSWIFDELPKAAIISISKPDTGDISLMFTSVVEVKEWLQNLGIGDHIVVQDEDEADDDAVHLHHDESAKNRDVPSSAALPVIRPALGRRHSISENAKVAMQWYLNHFLGNMDIANSREVCKFLEVFKLSFAAEYEPKLKEDYIMVKHLPKTPKADDDTKCCACHWFNCCNNWQKVWAVLKPGFLALLEDPFDTKLLDIIVFDVLPAFHPQGVVGGGAGDGVGPMVVFSGLEVMENQLD
ncbi:hypothetical protein Syun_023454 [Stephania yunnanensis]|uniref:Uncharacterized protein n=1 Tax=Stephania yunnanensis TaxID=152371 RepID=A0AAP0HZL5_9MAGN